ncbi:formyltetrahydrofolate deformylase [Sphingobacterium sp. UT-1RO-CII-1]|uniref:formyltetrahydrofolate deformylase n=1 Tax=Sphingobacterium sp. UT-1RO-CII-1 TaxID=2995225 RepID=UPI00227BCD79|nr:formyltetrahydrofolate deformylase [Sphingobacterium sp. UT-1RO-CII-1]MCY4779850.1 formyltetrahydrofolate deformylase [Sphingobacterium sp. UT-1RO-CII-1]
MTNQTLILIQCRDAIGLVAHVSSIITKHQLNITTMREYVDDVNQQFFLRVVCNGISPNISDLEKDLQEHLPANATVRINPPHQKKLVILVTKEYHCLADILVRHFFKSLNASVLAIIGNYDRLQGFSEKFDIPFHLVSHENKTKEQFEAELIQAISPYDTDYIILAKFMRILSPSFVATFENKLINIHHSFLPAFIGASPYRQAHTRGVKIIGATAHFVTNDLDEGPIIVQQTKRINHSYDVARLITAGQEIEKAVLSEAIQLLTEDKVMLHGNKTVVFE